MAAIKNSLSILFFALILGGCGGGGSGAGGTPPGGDGGGTPTIYYVSAAAPDNTGDGLTPATAKQDISAMIVDATAPGTIRVAGGTYPIDSSLGGNRVYLYKDLSLEGGYSLDFMTRDTVTYETILTDSASSANIVTNSHKTVHITSSVTSTSTIDGFTITGASGDFANTIYIDGGSPIIQNNNITGGAAGTTRAIVVISGNPEIMNNVINGGSASFSSTVAVYDIGGSSIHDNDINGGSSNTYSYGVYTTTISSEIYNNTIHGGSASGFSVGVYCGTNAITQVRDNYIHGGDSTTTSVAIKTSEANVLVSRNFLFGGNGNGSSKGVEVFSGKTTVVNNVIHGGDGNSGYGISNDASASIYRNNTINGGTGFYATGIRTWTAPLPNIDNNIIFTNATSGGICIREQGSDGDPASLNNNSLSSCTAATYLDADAGCTDNLDGDADSTTCNFKELQGLVDIGSFGGNTDSAVIFLDVDGLDNDINTMADNDWQLAGGNPAAITGGGLNGIDETWSFADDKNGVARPLSGNPWSIGAYIP